MKRLYIASLAAGTFFASVTPAIAWSGYNNNNCNCQQSSYPQNNYQNSSNNSYGHSNYNSYDDHDQINTMSMMYGQKNDYMSHFMNMFDRFRNFCFGNSNYGSNNYGNNSYGGNSNDSNSYN